MRLNMKATSKEDRWSGNKSGISCVFDGMAEAMDFIDDNVSITKTESSHTSSKSSDWDKGVGYKGARELVKKGWPEGMKDLKAKTEFIEHSVMEKGTDYHWDVVGRVFDVGEYLSGNPECWLDEHEEDKRRVFKLLLNGSVSWSVSADKIARRGAAICALADLLQRNPANIVELSMVFGQSGAMRDNGFVDFEIPIGVSPIDFNLTSYIVSHSSMFRRLGFAVMEALSAKMEEADGNSYIRGGYGYPDTPTTLVQDADIYLKEVRGRDSDFDKHFSDDESAVKWVEANLTKLTKETQEVEV